MNINATFSRIFMVSNDAFLHQQLETNFSSQFEISFFPDWEICFQNIHLRPSVIFFEATSDSTWGVSFLDKMYDFDKDIPIVVISDNNEITSTDFLSKSNVNSCFKKEEFTTENLLFLIKNIEQISRLQNQLENVENKMYQDFEKNMVYSCDAMQTVFQLIQKAASTNITCYISGEKGTGKGTTARIIHHTSKQKVSSFASLNIGAVPLEDLEKELFGEENADGKVIKKGKIELAYQGSLYLEDIHLLPLTLQSKILVSLQSNAFYRINGALPVPFDTRIIVSSPGNLFDEVCIGNFLETLYYRLMGLPISLPPLRERGNDILLLAGKITSNFATKNNATEKEISNDAKKKLLSYSFPGNVLELNSTIERAIVLSNTNIITADDIEFLNTSEELSFVDKDMTFEEYKSKIIHHYLAKYDNDVIKVSNKLDIGKSTIYRMLKAEKEKGKKKNELV